MARLGPHFWHQNPPRKKLCGSFFCVLSQKMMHIHFFLGAQNGVKSTRKHNTSENASNRPFSESGFSDGLLLFVLLFLAGAKIRPKEQSITCVFGCVAFSGVFWRLPKKGFHNFTLNDWHNFFAVSVFLVGLWFSGGRWDHNPRSNCTLCTCELCVAWRPTCATKKAVAPESPADATICDLIESLGLPWAILT